MHRRIFKYSLTSVDCLVEMPDRAIILSVENQLDDNVVIYAIVRPDEPMVKRRFISFPTGELLPDNVDKGNYIGTTHSTNNLWWHTFEVSSRYGGLVD